MDAAKITEVLNQYKSGTMDFPTASLELVLIGLNADQVILLLNKADKEKDAV